MSAAESAPLTALAIFGAPHLTELAVVDWHRGLCDRRALVVDCDKIDAAALVAAAQLLIGRAREPVAAIGIALSPAGGAADPCVGATADIAACAAALAGAFDVPIRAVPDSLCAPRAEAAFGAAAGCADHLHLGVGVDVGAIFLGGRPLWRGDGGPASPQHFVVDAHGPSCRCGGRGCLAACLADRHLAARAATAGLAQDVVERIGGGVCAVDAFVRAAARGNPLARVLCDEVADALGQAIGSLLNVFDVPLWVLHGIEPTSFAALEPRVSATMAQHSFAALRGGVRLVCATLPREGELVGAGLLALDALRPA